MDAGPCRKGIKQIAGHWKKVVLEEQALWATIPFYYQHSELPVLTVLNKKAGLGDPSTLEKISKHFRARPTDVHIVTYPKAGTSWIQEVAWLVNHDADIEASNSTPSSQRTIYIELDNHKVDKFKMLRSAEGARHVKWHHPAELLPSDVISEGRIIYLLRNPKDTAVSWYHFQRMNTLYSFEGSFDQFFELFLQNKVSYGSYWHHILSYWKLRDQGNILFLTYEEMHSDLSEVVRKVGSFLSKDLSKKQVEAIVEHCSFRQMRSNPMTNASKMERIKGEGKFMRKGQVGDWTNYFSKEQNQRMEDWITENTEGSDLPAEWFEQ